MGVFLNEKRNNLYVNCTNAVRDGSPSTMSFVFFVIILINDCKIRNYLYLIKDHMI